MPYTFTPAALPVAGGPVTISGPDDLTAAIGVSFGLLDAGTVLVDPSGLSLYVIAPAHNPGAVGVVIHLTTTDIAAGTMTYNVPATVIDWPTLPEVRTFLRIPSTDEDPVIDPARAAAIDYGNRRTNYRWVPGNSGSWLTPMPAAVHEAALIHASRLYKRRDSIDGTVGWADVGLTHVGRVDPDVEAIYSAIGPLVFG